MSAYNPIIAGKETIINHSEYIQAAKKYTPYDPKQAKAAARVRAGRPATNSRSVYVQGQRSQGNQETKTT